MLEIIISIAVMVCIALIGVLGVIVLFCIATDNAVPILIRLIVVPILIFLIVSLVILEINLFNILMLYLRGEIIWDV